MKRIVTGILAHVDSGKTTLSEAMLYEAGEIKKPGRVDHGDSFLDNSNLERNRGITIFSKQALLSCNDGNTQITLIDTPGHVDFGAEMERALQIMDYAILVISGSEGIQSHTETLWHLLEKHNIPTFLFVNKMDLVYKKEWEIVEELKAKFKADFVDFSRAFQKQEPELFKESVAVSDDGLMEEFLQSGSLNDDKIREAISKRKLFPCYFGSALKLEGADEILSALGDLTEEPVRGSSFGARVYKIGRDSQGNRLTYMKITGGTLAVKDVIDNEKINQIRIYSGQKFETADRVTAGTVCAVTGLTTTFAGQVMGDEPESQVQVMEPVLTYKVILPEGVQSHWAFSKLKMLEEEDPKLYVNWNSKSEELQVKLMGAMQLDVLKSLFKERFDTELNFDTGSIVYKETIAKPSEGMGHFEPLRHYAHVELLLEPLERGSGLVFDTTCSEDELDRNWQRLILTHLAEKEHAGVLTGSSVTDLKITLTFGKAHKKHTEGGDFRQATYRAVRNALMNAESVLLEPWYEFELNVPTNNLGKAMADMERMGGNFLPPENNGEMSLLKGSVAAAEAGDYQNEVTRYTKGRGRFACSLKGYEPCHNSAEVIEKIGYDPERDLENSADSVFCQGGSGVVVSWDKVAEYMGTNQEVAPGNEKPLVSDKDLNAIFERTYGKIDRKPRIAPKTVKIKSTAEEQFIKSAEGQQELEKVNYVPKKRPGYEGPEYILIDGYNLIHAWDKLKTIAMQDFGAARNALVDIMCNYHGYREKECHVIIVFDAYKVKGNRGSVEHIGGISIVYTKEAETADMYIEKATYEIAKHKKVRVVTSDGLEQLIIMGHGALRVSSQTFIDEIENTEREIRQFLG